MNPDRRVFLAAQLIAALAGHPLFLLAYCTSMALPFLRPGVPSPAGHGLANLAPMEGNAAGFVALPLLAVLSLSMGVWILRRLRGGRAAAPEIGRGA